MNIESIKKNKKSSHDWTIIETLQQLIRDLESGNCSYNKCFISLLSDENEGEYTTGFRMVKMRGYEVISLLEIMKGDLVNAINGLPSEFEAEE